LLTLPPLSLYIHIPWCVRKCPYCDFNSHAVSGNGLPEKRYVNRLLEDMDNELVGIQHRELHSIFIGGGTPSLFSSHAIDYLLSELEKKIPFKSDIEITMEANPSTFEQRKFAGFRAAGINRLSIGIQSFQDHHLKKLGRIHNGEESLKAATLARKSGFNNINLDIMHGLPDQSLHLAMQDLKAAIRCGPEHISWYQLTIEPNTVFYSKPPVLPEEELLWDIQEAGFEILTQAGFLHYEISAWTQKDKASQHNLNYWQFGDYIGIGAGAHGKITNLNHHTITRRWKTRMPSSYMNEHFALIAGEKVISHQELPLEFFLNTLRLKHGVPAHYFEQYTGLSLTRVTAALNKARKSGLMTTDVCTLQATDIGQRFLNDLLSYFM